MSRKLLLLAVLCGLVGSAVAQSASKSYVILARGQGKGSTNFVAQLGGSVTANLQAIGVVLAQSSDPNFAAKAAALPGVQAVAEDPAINWIPKETVSDPVELTLPVANQEVYSPIQWNLKLIHADQTAANGDRGFGARVAVVDSGIITTQPDLTPNLNLALSKSFALDPVTHTLEPLDPPAGVFNHGTHVAGIIAAAVNRLGTQGVAPQAEIVAVKVLSSATGSGSFGQIIQGILYASSPDVHADVINMSLGATFAVAPAGTGGNGGLFSALNRAVTYATARGTLVVSSAGNDGLNLNGGVTCTYPDGSTKTCSAFTVPAQSGNGMAISATTSVGFGLNPSGPITEAFASYSNYGQSMINVAAPGGDTPLYGTSAGMGACSVPLPTAGTTLKNTCFYFDMVMSPGGYRVNNDKSISYLYYWASGTSMAAPHVSGVAAILVGKYGHIGPAALQHIIQASAVDLFKPGADPYSGQGRVDALAATQLQ